MAVAVAPRHGSLSTCECFSTFSPLQKKPTIYLADADDLRRVDEASIPCHCAVTVPRELVCPAPGLGTRTGRPFAEDVQKISPLEAQRSMAVST
jgi:hypothetical protein